MHKIRHSVNLSAANVLCVTHSDSCVRPGILCMQCGIHCMRHGIPCMQRGILCKRCGILCMRPWYTALSQGVTYGKEQELLYKCFIKVKISVIHLFYESSEFPDLFHVGYGLVWVFWNLLVKISSVEIIEYNLFISWSISEQLRGAAQKPPPCALSFITLFRI